MDYKILKYMHADLSDFEKKSLQNEIFNDPKLFERYQVFLSKVDLDNAGFIDKIGDAKNQKSLFIPYRKILSIVAVLALVFFGAISFVKPTSIKISAKGEKKWNLQKINNAEFILTFETSSNYGSYVTLVGFDNNRKIKVIYADVVEKPFQTISLSRKELDHNQTLFKIYSGKPLFDVSIIQKCVKDEGCPYVLEKWSLGEL